LGTYQGLQILGSSDPFLDSLQTFFAGKPVWGLELYKDLAVIGSRFNGLYVYDMNKKSMLASFDTSKLGYCRRIRILSDTLFIATNAAPFYVPLKTLRLGKIKADDLSGFCTDFAYWNNTVLAAHYDLWFAPMLQVANSNLIKDSSFHFAAFLPQTGTLSIESDKDKLIVAGDGFNIARTRDGQTTSEILLNPATGKKLPGWDIEIVNGRTYIAIGEPDNLQQGMIHEMFTTSPAELKPQFYGLSLFYDSSWGGMWAGTEKTGLYYWPAVTSYFHLPLSIKNAYRLYRSGNGRTFVFNDLQAFEIDLSKNSSRLLHTEGNSFWRRQLYDVKSWNDTIAFLSLSELKLEHNGKVLFTKAFKDRRRGRFNTIEKIGTVLVLFDQYHDNIATIDLKNGQEQSFNVPSNQAITLPNDRGIFYYAADKGFGQFDSLPHSFKPDFPSVESFALSDDSLWILNPDGLTAYRIDNKSFTLTSFAKRDIQKVVPNFIPKWVCRLHNQLYIGNNAGFFLLNPATLLPIKYYYLGNFSDLPSPMVFADSMYFAHSNYIAVLTPGDLEYKGNKTEFNASVQPYASPLQFTPFSVVIRTNDYLQNNRSLKTLLLIKSHDTVTYFTTGDHFDFQSGLKSGDYIMSIHVDGREIDRVSVRIKIPITANPLFYVAIFSIIMALIGAWVYNLFNKKRHEKQILNNRLNLLKQNFGPHFIFNALNLIYTLVLEKKNDLAVQAINNFSDLHRYYLENINKPIISLAEEFRFIESYLELESSRTIFDTPFIYTISDVSSYHYVVPPMILQPLIENAVKYCRPPDDQSSQGRIWVTTSFEDERLGIFIENTVHPSGVIEGGNGIGLSLVQERIDIYNKSYNEHLLLQRDLQPFHSSSGYRIGVWLSPKNG